MIKGNSHKVLVIQRNGTTKWVMPSVKDTSRLFGVSPELIKERIEDGMALPMRGKLYYFDYALED